MLVDALRRLLEPQPQRGRSAAQSRSRRVRTSKDR
jgi:hypothetical protein